MAITIYSFSATGNSMTTASRLADQLGAKLIPVASTKHLPKVTEDADTVGFVFPVYYGDMLINLFGILPIKMKYLALADAALLIADFIMGTWTMRLTLVLSMLPFALFFGRDAYLMVRHDIWKLKNAWMNRK